LPNPIAHLRRPNRRARTRGFLRDRSGAMAVEFALVAAPLLFMLFSIIELALVFMVSSSLENATTEVARTIRTGAIQTAGGGSQTAFRNAICAKIGWMQASCQANLSVDVRTYAQFANQNAPDPVNSATKTFNSGATTYSVGVQGDIVLVRAFYRWKLISPFLKGGLERLSGGVTLLTAAATFKNEPY
jgi:Flp pilus assembly protein TadG